MPIPPVLPETVYGTFSSIQDGSVAVSLPPSVSSPAMKVYYNGEWYLLGGPSVALTVSSDAAIAGLESSINGLAARVTALEADVAALTSEVNVLQAQLAGLSVDVSDEGDTRTAALVYTDGVYGEQVVASRDYPI
jgi:hypothetical protein